MLAKKKLHFMHLPKTGGTSIITFLEHCFKQEEICPFEYIFIGPEWAASTLILQNLSDLTLPEFRFFKGALGWMPRKLIPKEQIETIIFLRDPIDRIVSLYNHLMGDVITFSDFPKRWSCIDDFILDQQFKSSLVSNQLLKLFCIDLYLEKYTENALLNKANNKDLYDPLGRNIEIDTPLNIILNIALERLHLCEFVGLTERFDESIDRMCMQYNFLSPKIKPKKNVSKTFVERSNLSSRIIDYIIEINSADHILYQEGLKIFENQKKVNVYYDRAKVEKKICDEFPIHEEIKFNFSDRILGEGWDDREGTFPNNFCWTIQRVSTLYFLIQGKEDFHISFIVIHSNLLDLEQKLTLTVNAYPISLVSSGLEEGGIIFEGIIPNYVLRKDVPILELVFSIPNLSYSAEDHDKRTLGFACKSIEIKPLRAAYLACRDAFFAEYYKAKYLQDQVTSQSILLSQKEHTIAIEKDLYNELKLQSSDKLIEAHSKIDEINSKLNGILQSRSFRLTKPLREIFSWLRTFCGNSKMQVG